MWIIIVEIFNLNKRNRGPNVLKWVANHELGTLLINYAATLGCVTIPQCLNMFCEPSI